MDNVVYDVAVIGLGYIGLPTAASFAARGKFVAGVDISTSTVDSVNRGEVPFVEPGMNELVADVVSAGRLVAMTEIPRARAYILALPTPLTPSKSADLSYLTSAVRSLAPQLHGDELVILESTSPPGTTRMLGDLIMALRSDLSLEPTEDKRAVHLVHSPERVLPGRIMIELESNDRVIGGLTPVGAQLAADLYRVICSGAIHTTDAETAEMTKLVENTFRDVNIAFANELSMVCDELSIDVWELIRLANHHPRVNILNPGPGVGGHCIAVDPWFIVDAFPQHAKLTRTSREVNDHKPIHLVQRILEGAEGFTSPKITILGLSFKANIDDIRESPAIRITSELARQSRNSNISVVEPHISNLPVSLQAHSNVKLDAIHEGLLDADIVVLLVDHDIFREIDYSSISNALIFDTKGFWHEESATLSVPSKLVV